ncbi:MAG: ArsR family transcriptional regulator [Bacteroidetes bacterium]|nr:ArsR family transcriptional regulator [Bacteroidota bacterium]|tara:strand:+ start:312 stop:593 length:282 start_codon:yes stop_codon:yes gene_type:complete
MTKLNSLLHQELRLSIISFLIGVEWADFNKLIEITSASKGNLSVQISNLQKAGYLKVKKSFKGNYPHTECCITELGRSEFEIYLENIKKMLHI